LNKPTFDWRLTNGIASRANFLILLVLLFSFPLLLKWTGALSVTQIDPQSPAHTTAILKFCLVVIVFSWTCFFIALIGVRNAGRISWKDLIGARWGNWQSMIGDLGLAVVTLFAMVVIGTLLNTFLGPFQHDSAAMRVFLAQNFTEAFAFLAAALTAGFVEEFVFRGYLQKQFQTLCGNTFLASILQLYFFVHGHFYQGLLRLIPVFLIGAVLTIVALRRKSLIPGMLAHSVGDGFVAFSFFVRHL
jgi:membrane protease YdiL (CAAX protease family)